MPDSWSTVITQTLARVRDPGGSVHSLALCKNLLTRLERLYNNQLRLVLQDFTLTTQPHLQLYTLAEATGDAGPQGIQIVKMTHQNRPLDRLTFPYLQALDPRWPRAVGPRLEGFIQLGYTLVLVWPSLAESSTVTVTATQLTPDLDSLANDATLAIPSQMTPKLAHLLELLLLLRQRDMLAFNALMQQLYPGKGQEHAPNQAPRAPQRMVP